MPLAYPPGTTGRSFAAHPFARKSEIAGQSHSPAVHSRLKNLAIPPIGLNATFRARCRITRRVRALAPHSCRHNVIIVVSLTHALFREIDARWTPTIRTCPPLIRARFHLYPIAHANAPAQRHWRVVAVAASPKIVCSRNAVSARSLARVRTFSVGVSPTHTTVEPVATEPDPSPNKNRPVCSFLQSSIRPAVIGRARMFNPVARKRRPIQADLALEYAVAAHSSASPPHNVNPFPPTESRSASPVVTR